MDKMLVGIVGRGHGGTRAAAGWFRAAGFDLGETNGSLDRKPFQPVYRAGRIAMEQVRHLGGRAWDLQRLLDCPIPAEWTRLWEEHLHAMLDCDGDLVAWKLPETVFSWPWLVRSFPEVVFIEWHRDPRAAILGSHITDDLSGWGLEGWPSGLPTLEERALSWRVQFQVLTLGRRPPRWVRLRLRDYVLHQTEAGRAVEAVTGVPMPQAPGNPLAIDRWRSRQREFGRARDVIAPYLDHFAPGPLHW